MTDTRERVRALIRAATSYAERWGASEVAVEGYADRILDALRDSEGREVVAEGWLAPTEYDRAVNGSEWIEVYTGDSFNEETGDIPVALIRRQEAERDADTGGEDAG